MSALREQNHAATRAMPDGSGPVIQKGSPELSVHVGHNSDGEHASKDLLVVKEVPTLPVNAGGTSDTSRGVLTRRAVKLLTEHPTWATLQIAAEVKCSTAFVRSVRSRMRRSIPFTAVNPRPRQTRCLMCGGAVLPPHRQFCSRICSQRRGHQRYYKHTRAIRLGRELCESIEPFAKKRGLHLCEMARQILEAVVESGLVNAVLDDGE